VKYKANVETKDSIFSMGKVSLGFDAATGHIVVGDTTKMNVLGKNLGYHVNDEILSVNGEDLSAANANNLFQAFGSNSKPGDAMVIKVARKNARDVKDTLELKSVMTKFPKIKYDALELADNPSQQQLLIRNAWLKPNN